MKPMEMDQTQVTGSGSRMGLSRTGWIGPVIVSLAAIAVGWWVYSAVAAGGASCACCPPRGAGSIWLGAAVGLMVLVLVISLSFLMSGRVDAAVLALLW